MKRGKYSNCMKSLIYYGFSEEEAKLACAKHLTDAEEEGYGEDWNLQLVDSEEVEDAKGQECIQKKIHIFIHEEQSSFTKKIVNKN